ncbi:hypothetical protein L0Y69_03205 [bacterium]|nr:hypothetical protein [bacterium]
MQILTEERYADTILNIKEAELGRVISSLAKAGIEHFKIVSKDSSFTVTVETGKFQSSESALQEAGVAIAHVL